MRYLFLMIFFVIGSIGCADATATEDVVLLKEEGGKLSTPLEGDLIIYQADYADPRERLRVAVQSSLDLTEEAVALAVSAGEDPNVEVEVWLELVQRVVVDGEVVVEGDFGEQTLDCVISTFNSPDFQIGNMYRDEDGDVVGVIRYSDTSEWLAYRIDPIWL